jgi:prophage tail gpP-like protein
MAKPVHVFVDRQELTGYTSLNLRRSKNEMTGQLSLDIFMKWLPEEPVLEQVGRGREVLVYIGGHLAFTGFIERRQDKGQKSSNSTSVGPDSYSVTFTCRGKTRALIDSSHQAPTTILRRSGQDIFGELVQPWKVEVEWEAEAVNPDRVRLRDGARVVDEIQRLSEQFSVFVYETRFGTLRVTDEVSNEQGEAIVLGTNILSFSTDQAADKERSEVMVKGQRVRPADWGELAVLPTLDRVADDAARLFSPTTVQVFGDADEATLKRRTQYEANKRAAEAKRITLEVFHVQQSNGEPWDLGRLHYVEIPPAGVFGFFEVVELNYDIQNDKTLKTTLTLAPPPVKAKPAATGALSSLPEPSEAPASPAGRKEKFNCPAEFASSWDAPSLTQVGSLSPGDADLLGGIEVAQARPPSSLPPSYKGAGTQ